MSSSRERVWTIQGRGSRTDFWGIRNWKVKKRKRIMKGKLRRNSQKCRWKVRRVYFPRKQVLRKCLKKEKVTDWIKCSWEFKLTEDSELAIIFVIVVVTGNLNQNGVGLRDNGGRGSGNWKCKQLFQRVLLETEQETYRVALKDSRPR